MGLLDALFRGEPPTLSATQAARLARWRALPKADLRLAPGAARLVSVDVESSGLNPRSDRLIAVGGVVIERGRIDLQASMHRVLRQADASSTENILVHGIGGSEQREGEAPADALLDFLEFAGKAPLLGYHAAFDDAMLRTALAAHLGLRWKHPWIDLAAVAPAALGPEGRHRKSLDDWLALFGIEVFKRHDAVADALATAQLLLAVLARAGPAAPRSLAAMLWDPADPSAGRRG